MKFYFSGNYLLNGGPQNVNKEIVKLINRRMSYTKLKNKYLRIIEVLWKILCCKVVCFSGISTIDFITIPFAKCLNKRIIYIMHGCLDFEYRKNRKRNNPIGLTNEKLMLKNADRILCVSNSFEKFIAYRFPEISEKLGVLTNGINWQRMDQLSNSTSEKSKNMHRLLLMGGGRITKHNLQICQAVQLLNEEKKVNYKVDVYGYDEPGDDTQAMKLISCVSFNAVVPHEQIYKELKDSRLFIQNSEIESFGLGVIDALCCGCDLLISRNVGVRDIIPALSKNDFIDDIMNIQHIKNKISYILQHSNNSRLLSSINRQQTSTATSVDNLLKEAELLC